MNNAQMVYLSSVLLLISLVGFMYVRETYPYGDQAVRAKVLTGWSLLLAVAIEVIVVFTALGD